MRFSSRQKNRHWKWPAAPLPPAVLGLIVTTCALLVSQAALTAREDVYQKPSEFIAATFGKTRPAAGAVTLTSAHQAAIRRLIGKPYASGRIRYWTANGRTAWILNEIGKTKPITVGYVVAGAQIESMKVLIYRESHGWEVRRPFFTKQFKGAALHSTRGLTMRIDNIAGATLSVRALTKMGKLALYLESIRTRK